MKILQKYDIFYTGNTSFIHVLCKSDFSGVLIWSSSVIGMKLVLLFHFLFPFASKHGKGTSQHMGCREVENSWHTFDKVSLLWIFSVLRHLVLCESYNFSEDIVKAHKMSEGSEHDSQLQQVWCTFGDLCWWSSRTATYSEVSRAGSGNHLITLQKKVSSQIIKRKFHKLFSVS